jgi:hypothetical protein
MVAECGYCGGVLVSTVDGYVHRDSGDRVTATPGDYVSERHNRAGTKVLFSDVLDREDPKS